MYSLLKSRTYRDLLFQQLPTLGSALLLAEIFYKFGSFTLEAIAFLLTWAILDAIYGTLSRISSQRVPAE